jgi:hypothetical protein
MRNRFLISAATIALIAGTGFANAQGTGMSREQGGAAAQQSAPSTGTSASTPSRDATEPTKPSSGMKATQSEPKSPAGAAKNQRTEENAPNPNAQGQNAPGQKSKSMNSENETKSGKDIKGGKDLKAEDREGRGDGMKAEGREGRDRDQNAQIREGRDRDQNAQSRDRNDKLNAETRSQTTTGQAGAGAKLSTEQRTKITTVFKSQRLEPVNNVNFSISLGTRVPREGVSFRPLPAEVVTIYPEWRGYEFIVVRNQIVVVDPVTYEIVAILDV